MSRLLLLCGPGSFIRTSRGTYKATYKGMCFGETTKAKGAAGGKTGPQSVQNDQKERIQKITLAYCTAACYHMYI